MTPDQIVEFAESLGRIAASGGGATALAIHLSDTVGAGVLVEDARWQPIATAGDAPLPPTARGLFEPGDCDDSAPREIRGFDRGSVVPIRAGGTHLGWISVFLAAQSRDDFAPLARLTASAIAVELARDGSYGDGRKHTFWERLFSGAYRDAHGARDDAAARGISSAAHYVIVVLEADDERAQLRALATEAFRAGDADVGVVERDTRLWFAIPVARAVDGDNAITAATLLPKTALKRAHVPIRFSGGVSTVVSLLDVPRGLRTAETALTIARRIHGETRVAAYDELAPYPLLMEGASVEALKEFAGTVLAPLRSYDEKHLTELERTLRCYFRLGQNVKIAAAELGVHRHTVFYRLRQIGEISSRSLENAHDQLTLRLAIAIDALHTN